MHNCLKSLHNLLAFSSRDWSQDERDAWIWGIICGWDEDSFEELSDRFQWGPEQVTKLKKLNSQFQEFERAAHD